MSRTVKYHVFIVKDFSKNGESYIAAIADDILRMIISSADTIMRPLRSL